MFLGALNPKNTNLASTVNLYGTELYEAANPYIKVNIRKEELNQYLEKCNKQQKQQLSDRKGDIQKLTQAAKTGDLEAQTDLALHYLQGAWVLKDINQGMKWLTSAAKDGHTRAQYNLGAVYATGELGTTKDLKKTAVWIKKAHENGHPQAQEMWNDYELWKY